MPWEGEGEKRISGIFPKKRLRYWKGGKSVITEDEGGKHVEAQWVSVALTGQSIYSKNEKGSEFGRNVVSFSQVQLRVLN